MPNEKRVKSFLGRPLQTTKIQTHIQECVLTLTNNNVGILKNLSKIISVLMTNALFHYMLMVWKEHYLLEEILKTLKTLKKK